MDYEKYTGRKEEWRPGNMLYPLPVVLVSCCDGKDRDNLLTIAWVGTVCSNPPCISISVRKERYSYDMIRNTKEFAVNLTTEEMAAATDFCGVRSGRDIDKWEACHLTREKAGKIRAPLVAQSPVNIECKVIKMVELGTHDMFIGEVVAVHADREYLDENGCFDFSKASPIVYSHGGYFSLGKKVGTFGYSVRKKSSGRKKKRSEDGHHTDK